MAMRSVTGLAPGSTCFLIPQQVRDVPRRLEIHAQFADVLCKSSAPFWWLLEFFISWMPFERADIENRFQGLRESEPALFPAPSGHVPAEQDSDHLIRQSAPAVTCVYR